MRKLIILLIFYYYWLLEIYLALIIGKRYLGNLFSFALVKGLLFVEVY